ncbi:hypothetical protein [Candidatus Solirubrobacter pratensis]|uniref:hypothetical protein n=1 Tax=Candidatus Solirubrobacter pratensis TaxID=1298857 RepID=UPI0018CB6828|nr:hypothetical protein [Candidatus Solirubrobacter pratensis]
MSDLPPDPDLSVAGLLAKPPEQGQLRVEDRWIQASAAHARMMPAVYATEALPATRHSVTPS